MLSSSQTKDPMAKKLITIRLDEEKILKPLNEIAVSENRTRSNLIETALLELIRKKGKSKSKGKTT